MNSTLILGQSAMPLIKGICYLLPAEQAGELVTVIAEEGGRLDSMPFIETGGTLPCTELRRLTRLALHIPADHEHRFRFNVNTISGPM